MTYNVALYDAEAYIDIQMSRLTSQLIAFSNTVTMARPQVADGGDGFQK
jgi:hypothetical protein